MNLWTVKHWIINQCCQPIACMKKWAKEIQPIQSGLLIFHWLRWKTAMAWKPSKWLWWYSLLVDNTLVNNDTKNAFAHKLSEVFTTISFYSLHLSKTKKSSCWEKTGNFHGICIHDHTTSCYIRLCFTISQKDQEKNTMVSSITLARPLSLIWHLVSLAVSVRGVPLRPIARRSQNRLIG